jgi:hypothetical protein
VGGVAGEEDAPRPVAGGVPVMEAEVGQPDRVAQPQAAAGEGVGDCLQVRERGLERLLLVLVGARHRGPHAGHAPGRGPAERKEEQHPRSSDEDVCGAALQFAVDLEVGEHERVRVTSALERNPGGGFQPRVDYPTGRRPQEVVIGDLTGDGKPDLATGNRSDTVSVLANNGNGTFESPVDYRAGSGPRAIAIGDLSGDGRLDLATANTNVNVNTVSVLINRGNGTFRAKRDYRAGNGPVSVAIGEVNGDGSRDLAAADVSGNGVSVFVNKGNGSFLPRRDHRTGREPWSVAIADLTGDGKRDVATANSVANSVSVLANTTGLCTVPTVTGMVLATAKHALAHANCRVAKIRSVYSKDVRRGRVVSQTPRPGTVLRNGGRVGLVVSRGRKH